MCDNTGEPCRAIWNTLCRYLRRIRADWFAKKAPVQKPCRYDLQKRWQKMACLCAEKNVTDGDSFAGAERLAEVRADAFADRRAVVRAENGAEHGAAIAPNFLQMTVQFFVQKVYRKNGSDA